MRPPRLFLPVALAAALATLPLAAEVTLRADDGDIAVEGELLSYDGAFYTVDTIYGALTLDADRVTCAGAGCPDPETHVVEVTIAGSPLMGAVLMPALLEHFARDRGLRSYREERAADEFTYVLLDPARRAPVARIRLVLSDSDRGLLALLDGEADIALSLTKLDDAEVRARRVAVDALVPIVAPDNPLDRLAVIDLAELLSGRIGEWAQLAGPATPVALHLHPDTDGVQQALEAQLLGPKDLPVTLNAQRHPTAGALADAVAADPHALGVTVLSRAEPARPVALAGACGLGHAATRLALKTGDYPLTLPLHVHTRVERLAPVARGFLDFMATEAARPAIELAGFIDLSPEIVPDTDPRVGMGDTDAAVADALGHLAAARPAGERLTTTVRFDPGSSTLDGAARGAVRRLVRSLADGAHAGREIVFAGFTDASDTEAAGLRIARARARVVRDAVRNAARMAGRDGPEMAVAAYGAALPVACNDTAPGRAANRRVEVWLR